MLRSKYQLLRQITAAMFLVAAVLAVTGLIFPRPVSAISFCAYKGTWCLDGCKWDWYYWKNCPVDPDHCSWAEYCFKIVQGCGSGYCP